MYEEKKIMKHFAVKSFSLLIRVPPNTQNFFQPNMLLIFSMFMKKVFVVVYNCQVVGTTNRFKVLNCYGGGNFPVTIVNILQILTTPV